jgi:16S rRNA (uracil1498-N3)-methyltransferase
LRIHRIHTAQALQPGREVLLEDNSSHYLSRVLRVGTGDPVVLFNGDGHDYVAAVLRPARRQLAVRVDSRLPGLAEPPVAITVVQAVSRGERMDQTLQKCTELGAAAFQLLVSERVEVRLGGNKLGKRMEHWRGVIVAACEQCGRARVPELFEPIAVAAWLGRATGAPRLVLDPQAAEPLARAFADPGPLAAVELAVGPEGGFSELELAEMRAHGTRPVSLGPRTLRTETAAPAALAVLQGLLGDFR